jgi:hypothetical protein
MGNRTKPTINELDVVDAVTKVVDVVMILM